MIGRPRLLDIFAVSELRRRQRRRTIGGSRTLESTWYAVNDLRRRQAEEGSAEPKISEISPSEIWSGGKKEEG